MNHPINSTMGSTSPPWNNVLVSFLLSALMRKSSPILLVAGVMSALSCADPATAPSLADRPGVIPETPSHVMTITYKNSDLWKENDCEQCGGMAAATYGNLGPSYYQTRSVTTLFAVYNYGPAQSNEYECSNFWDYYCGDSWNIVIPCNVYRVNMLNRPGIAGDSKL